MRKSNGGRAISCTAACHSVPQTHDVELQPRELNTHILFRTFTTILARVVRNRQGAGAGPFKVAQLLPIWAVACITPYYDPSKGISMALYSPIDPHSTSWLGASMGSCSSLHSSFYWPPTADLGIQSSSPTTALRYPPNGEPGAGSYRGGS